MPASRKTTGARCNPNEQGTNVETTNLAGIRLFNLTQVRDFLKPV
jgi:hypothetical protein